MAACVIACTGYARPQSAVLMVAVVVMMGMVVVVVVVVVVVRFEDATAVASCSATRGWCRSELDLSILGGAPKRTGCQLHSAGSASSVEMTTKKKARKSTYSTYIHHMELPKEATINHQPSAIGWQPHSTRAKGGGRPSIGKKPCCKGRPAPRTAAAEVGRCVVSSNTRSQPNLLLASPRIFSRSRSDEQGCVIRHLVRSKSPDDA